METLLKVKELLYAHRFTIAGARRKLREGGLEPPGPDDASTEEVARMRTTLAEIRDEVLALLHELDEG